MKWTKFVSLIALLAMVAGTGCKRNPQGTTPLPGYGKGNVGPDRPVGPIGPGIADEGSTGVPISGNLSTWMPAADQPAVLRDNTVYFDFDRSDIRASETSKLDAIASYLKGGNRAVRVEGHCDERGTEEYNRSLGERRALSAREYLVRAGVSPEALDTISHGEDRPAVPGRTDAAWSKNRRAEFVLLQAPGGVGATTNP